MTLHWDEKYSLGNEKIDAEHHIFLDLIIEFDSLAALGASKDKLVRTLREIGKYAEFHFLSEENLMIDCNYPDLERHIKLHRNLVASLEDQRFKFVSAMTGPSQVLISYFSGLHCTRPPKTRNLFLSLESSSGWKDGDVVGCATVHAA